MLPRRGPPSWGVAKWALIVVLAIVALLLLVFAFEFVRLLVDPGARA